MTTPKNAPAPTPKPESEAAKASRIAPLNLSALRPVKAAPPVRTGGTGKTARDNSVAEGWLSDLAKTRKEGERTSSGLALSIPIGAYGELRSRLNQAARKLGVGVTIDPSVKPDGPDNKTMTLTFAVQDRRTYVRKPKTEGDKTTDGGK